jgi:hypothetical protein
MKRMGRDRGRRSGRGIEKLNGKENILRGSLNKKIGHNESDLSESSFQTLTS